MLVKLFNCVRSTNERKRARGWQSCDPVIDFGEERKVQLQLD